MDVETSLAVGLQVLALCCVVAGLVLYLVCKVRRTARGGRGRAVVITSADNVLGLQLTEHLVSRGFRVFAGFKPSDPDSQVIASTAKQVLDAKLKHMEATWENGTQDMGTLVALPLDITREDLLHNAVGTIRRHLPAGQDGVWAVINTAGVYTEDQCSWDAVLKVNVAGTLKLARTFVPLLRSKRGRLLTFGGRVKALEGGDLAVQMAEMAGRLAVEGASTALRKELRPLGVQVVTLRTDGLSIASLFKPPALRYVGSAEAYVSCPLRALPENSLQVLEDALLTERCRDTYQLTSKSPLQLLTRSLNGAKHKPLLVV